MRIAVGVVCLSILLAGCAGPLVGRADPTVKAMKDPVFNPCDDIPDDVVVALGLDPATKERDIMDVHQPGWNICAWKDDSRFLTVFSTIYTLDDIRNNNRYWDFSDVVVNGRRALMFRDVTDKDNEVCDVATASNGGAVMFSISQSGVKPVADEPCTAVRAMAGALVPYVPE